MKLRTVTKQNGADDDSEREMHFGWDVIGTITGLIVAGFAAWLSLRIDVQAVQTQQRIEHEDLPNAIDYRIMMLDRDVLSRTEFQRHTHSGRVPPPDGR